MDAAIFFSHALAMILYKKTKADPLTESLSLPWSRYNHSPSPDTTTIQNVVTLIWSVVDHHGLSHLISSPELFERFLLNLAKTYKNNEYHNLTHALHVTISVSHLISMTSFNLSPMDKLVLIIAAIAHDAEHPGNNNEYQRENDTELYKANPVSTLESNSAEIVKKLSKDYLFLYRSDQSSSSKTENDDNLNLRRTFGSHVHTLILSTDISMGDVAGTRLKSALKTPPPHDKVDVMAYLLRMADIACVFQPSYGVYCQWARNLMIESAVKELGEFVMRQKGFLKGYVRGELMIGYQSGIFEDKVLLNCLDDNIERLERKTVEEAIDDLLRSEI